MTLAKGDVLAKVDKETISGESYVRWAIDGLTSIFRAGSLPAPVVNRLAELGIQIEDVVPADVYQVVLLRKVG